MAKALDILKELEEIGAIGGKIQIPAARRAAVVLAPIAPDPEPVVVPAIEQITVKPSVSSEHLNSFVTGFSEQLEILEGALQGMLGWCAQAREELLSQQVEPEPDYEDVAEVGLAAKLAELPVEPVEEVISEAAPEVVEASDPEPTEPTEPAKPMLSVEEVKAKFILPGSLTAELANLRRPKNGAPSVTSSSVPTPELENHHG